jgi:hypothetical protein
METPQKTSDHEHIPGRIAPLDHSIALWMYLEAHCDDPETALNLLPWAHQRDIEQHRNQLQQTFKRTP